MGSEILVPCYPQGHSGLSYVSSRYLGSEGERGSGILGGFCCFAILPQEIAGTEHNRLCGKALRAIWRGARLAGPTHHYIQSVFADSALAHFCIGVPRNGTIAVTLVQYAGVSAPVEVPFTLISSEADAISITSQISAITQLGGGTNPGDGVNAALVVLNASGRPI